MVLKSDSPTGYYVQQRPWTPTKRRGPIAAEYTSPGPAAFTLPSTIGAGGRELTGTKSPAFSFGIKTEEKREVIKPGPGSYNISGISQKGKDIVQAPTISGRLQEPAPFKTPAPGAYSPEKAGKTVLNGSPSYTFGNKAKDPKQDNFPAPNSYNVDIWENTQPQSPSYSMGTKLNDATINKNPGPGSYNIPSSDVSRVKSPAYTLSQRTPIITDRTQKPGPGTHSPEKVWINKQNSPQYSFGIRHTPYIVIPTFKS
ncbi:outer dense fiber protein 3-like isoform X2 [Limulus polyphemus]|uniref:Outer dense fiber protein 3-like isoform X2 n=1 Tax=Limulus polyphemus TaxID=6850 RepID=A0ABM1S3N9_LIMPO|nr:outer dense fiber protein 3-like isoform X2 [Limulus polyphemus]